MVSRFPIHKNHSNCPVWDVLRVSCPEVVASSWTGSYFKPRTTLHRSTFSWSVFVIRWSDHTVNTWKKHLKLSIYQIKMEDIGPMLWQYSSLPFRLEPASDSLSARRLSDKLTSFGQSDCRLCCLPSTFCWLFSYSRFLLDSIHCGFLK